MKRVILGITILILFVTVGFGYRSHAAFALPQDLKVISVTCASNPEITVVQNTGLLPLSLDGFAINDLAGGVASFFQLPAYLALQPGQQATFYSGPAAPGGAANPYTLTHTYIYNHALARSGTEGAILTYNGAAISTKLCAETPTATPSPAPAPFNEPATATAVATSAITNTPLPTQTPLPVATGTISPGVTPASHSMPAPTSMTVATPSPMAATATATSSVAPTPTTASYASGWNLVAGTNGTTFDGAARLYAIPADGSAPVLVDPSEGAVAGQAYWAYFGTNDPAPGAVLQPAPSQALTVPIQTGVWTFIGNPTLEPVVVSGADEVVGFDPAQGYLPEQTIPPGFGAGVFSYTNNQVTLSPLMGAPSLPAATPAPGP